MQNTHTRKKADGRRELGVRSARRTALEKTLSVLLSITLVATMSPLSDSNVVLAFGAENYYSNGNISGGGGF